MDRCFAVRKSAEYKKDRRFVGLVQNRTDVLKYTDEKEQN